MAVASHVLVVLCVVLVCQRCADALDQTGRAALPLEVSHLTAKSRKVKAVAAYTVRHAGAADSVQDASRRDGDTDQGPQHHF